MFLNINGRIINSNSIAQVYITIQTTNGGWKEYKVLVIKMNDSSEIIYEANIEKLHNLHSELSKYLDVIDIPTDLLGISYNDS